MSDAPYPQSQVASPGSTPRQTVPPAVILAVLSFAVFVAADDLTVVSTLLRQIIFDLGITLPEGLDQAAWIVNVYLIAYIAVMPFVGRLSDIVGRQRVFLMALLIFLIGSIWVPLASNYPSFLAGRALTAVGGGAMIPVSMAIIADIYPAQNRSSALGILSAVDTAGWVWGPLYGALLIRLLDWRWQFYLNIPLALLGLILAKWSLKDLPEPATRQRIDVIGTVLLTAALIGLNVALLQGSGALQSIDALSTSLLSVDQGINWPLLLLSGGLFMLFVWWQLRLTRRTQSAEDSTTPPLIDLNLFRRRNFSPAMAINFLVGSILIIAMVNIPLIINIMEGDPRQAALISGLVLTALTLSMAVAALVSGWLTGRWSYRLVTGLGLLGCVAGFGWMGLTWQANSVYSIMVRPLVILGIGFGLVTPPIGAAVVNAVKSDQHGIAASLAIVLRLIGMSVGLSALTAWGLRRFEELRTTIVLPDLPFSDPVYQQAIIDGLSQLTVRVLTETFIISALVAAVALLIALRLRRDASEAA